MRTDELIQLLATDAQPAPSQSIERRLALAALAGLAGAGVLLAWRFGVRPDLAQALALPMFWGKFAFAGALAAAGLALLRRLARPGLPAGRPARWLPLPVLVLWSLALVALVQAAPGERLPLVLGQTWRTCPFNIALLSAPALVAAFWALRGGAPTRLAWTGAGAGLLAGALATLVYALHCPEMASPFLGVWYVAGMAVPTALGALAGPRWLRW